MAYKSYPTGLLSFLYNCIYVDDSLHQDFMDNPMGVLAQFEVGKESMLAMQNAGNAGSGSEALYEIGKAIIDEINTKNQFNDIW